MSSKVYPDLEKFSKTIGIDPDRLVAAFKLESAFHTAVLEEPDPLKRNDLYREIYQAVHPLYGERLWTGGKADNPMDPLVRRFRREVKGRSIIDMGCGNGQFLHSVAEQYPHKELVGVDVDVSAVHPHEEVRLISASVTDLHLEETFDVVFTHHVVEHLAPADLSGFMDAVKRCLRPGGRFILIMPHRLFGPSDVTRIIDCSQRNRVPAQGTHLNESTYTEMIKILKSAGFSQLQTCIPFSKLHRIRVPAGWFRYLESSPFLLQKMYGSPDREQAHFTLEVCLIGTYCP